VVACWPAAGTVLITLPFGNLSLASLVVLPTAKFAALICSVAFFDTQPTTSGTVVAGGAPCSPHTSANNNSGNPRLTNADLRLSKE
jgi:hypothetical protein